MATTELKEPVPRVLRTAPTRTAISLSGVLHLPAIRRQPVIDFFSLLNRRRSRRSFGPLSLTQLSHLLWAVQGTRATKLADRHHPLPSPGGLHAIRLLLFNVPGFRHEVFEYSPEYHILGALQLPQKGAAPQTLRTFGNILPIGAGTVIWFLGDLKMIARAYQHPESLMWREAGVITAAIYLAAEAAKLNCCALGNHGPLPQQVVATDPEAFVGLGSCVIGRRY